MFSAKPSPMLSKTQLSGSLVIVAATAVTASFLQCPARAASFTVNGFTGAFAPTNWKKDPAGANITTTPADVTLSMDATGSASAAFIFDTAKLNATYPGWVEGTVKFNWTWTAPAGNTPFSTSDIQYQINNLAPVVLSKYTGPEPPTFASVADINNFITKGNNVSFKVAAGDQFLFRLQNVTAPFDTSSSVISGFSFTGTDGAPTAAAPAPLPILGAAAAFAFGRRIRRRLSANTSSTDVA